MGPSRRLNHNALRTGIGPRGPSVSLELPAEASATKVSKPVLFVLKMTDFQYAHKKDSKLEAARFDLAIGGRRLGKKGAYGQAKAPFLNRGEGGNA